MIISRNRSSVAVLFTGLIVTPVALVVSSLAVSKVSESRLGWQRLNWSVERIVGLVHDRVGVESEGRSIQPSFAVERAGSQARRNGEANFVIRWKPEMPSVIGKVAQNVHLSLPEGLVGSLFVRRRVVRENQVEMSFLVRVLQTQAEAFLPLVRDALLAHHAPDLHLLRPIPPHSSESRAHAVSSSELVVRLPGVSSAGWMAPHGLVGPTEYSRFLSRIPDADPGVYKGLVIEESVRLFQRDAKSVFRRHGEVSSAAHAFLASFIPSDGFRHGHSSIAKSGVHNQSVSDPAGRAKVLSNVVRLTVNNGTDVLGQSGLRTDHRQLFLARQADDMPSFQVVSHALLVTVTLLGHHAQLRDPFVACCNVVKSKSLRLLTEDQVRLPEFQVQTGF